MAAFITAEIDTRVSGYLNDFAQGLENAIKFGCEQARVALKNTVLGQIIEEIAGGVEGFPRSYLHHLIVAMYSVPLTVTASGDGLVEIFLGIGALGNESDLDKGRHQNAMLGTLSDGFQHSFRITTKPLLQRVQLPYEGDGSDLMNPPDVRLAWWNEAIVAHNTPYTMVGRNWGWTKPASRTQEANAWVAENVPTYEQVATARANVWASLGVAPEWLLLENGTPAYYGSGANPVIEPQGFSSRVSVRMAEVAQEYIAKAILSFQRLLEERNVIGIKGPQNRPYNTLGQFVNYKDLLV